VNLQVEVSTVGKLFTSGALAVAELRAAPAIAQASDELASAIRGKAPRKTGRLQSAIRAIGFGFARRVEIDVRYAIPLDQGFAPAGSNRGIRKAGRKRAKVAGPVHFIPGREFFYRTFDSIAPSLQAEYFDKLGIQIVEDLES
jgi:hypothetical protein